MATRTRKRTQAHVPAEPAPTPEDTAQDREDSARDASEGAGAGDTGSHVTPAYPDQRTAAAMMGLGLLAEDMPPDAPEEGEEGEALPPDVQARAERWAVVSATALVLKTLTLVRCVRVPARLRTVRASLSRADKIARGAGESWTQGRQIGGPVPLMVVGLVCATGEHVVVEVLEDRRMEWEEAQGGPVDAEGAGE